MGFVFNLFGLTVQRDGVPGVGPVFETGQYLGGEIYPRTHQPSAEGKTGFGFEDGELWN